MNWKGVLPAITTCFDEDYQVDHEFMSRHIRWLLQNGCSGAVVCGSLGEGATLSFDEKVQIMRTCTRAVDGRSPIAAAISSLTTAEAVDLAKAAADQGCEGLMVLPPYVYKGSWREMKAHVAAVFNATPLGCMLYNNPIAYGTDFLPEQIDELSREFENMEAVKESSGDARRVAAIRALTGERLHVLVGVDDAVLEAVAVGAVGWIAGLANALPRESVGLLNLGLKGDREQSLALYHWFLPLLRMDTTYDFVQLIKLVQAEIGIGNARVRAPRMELAGKDLEAARRTIAAAMRTRPEKFVSSAMPGVSGVGARR